MMSQNGKGLAGTVAVDEKPTVPFCAKPERGRSFYLYRVAICDILRFCLDLSGLQRNCPSIA
jgi:hypothetical protein